MLESFVIIVEIYLNATVVQFQSITIFYQTEKKYEFVIFVKNNTSIQKLAINAEVMKLKNMVYEHKN
jgi:hypothetical protein